MIKHKVTLIVDRDDGVVGLEDDYNVEGYEQIAVEVELNLPSELFEPVKVRVNVPKEFLENQPIQGEVEAIQVPVMIAGREGQLKIEEELVKPGRGTNILAILRKAIFGEKKLNE